jgi:hypothetical protein
MENKSHKSDETEDDIQQDAVLNLLGFRNITNNSFNIIGSNQQERAVNLSGENSTIIDSFQPKFLVIYDKFVEYCEV